MDNYVENYKSLLVELYIFYASVYNSVCDMSRWTNISIHPTEIHHDIASIISQEDSFIEAFSFLASFYSYAEINNYLNYYFEITPFCVNILKWWKKKLINIFIENCKDSL